MPGKPNGLGHYEFIRALPPEALQDRLQQAVGCRFREECRQAAESLKNLLMGNWPNFARLRVSLCGTPRWDKPHRCTPIINSAASFLRTLKCHSRRSWASDPDCLKRKPVVCVHERRANRDRSRVVGRGRINLMMLSLIALAWQKQLARLWQAASQPASQVGQVVHTTAFLVGTAFLARRTDFFCCERKMGVRETTRKNKILFCMLST
jgi:hypothetical protein